MPTDEEVMLSEFERVTPDLDDWRNLRHLRKLRKVFVWTDKEGKKHKLNNIDDTYLQNIINFLKKKVAETPEFDSMPIGSEGYVQVSNDQYIEELETLIEFLMWEQAQRQLLRC